MKDGVLGGLVSPGKARGFLAFLLVIHWFFDRIPAFTVGNDVGAATKIVLVGKGKVSVIADSGTRIEPAITHSYLCSNNLSEKSLCSAEDFRNFLTYWSRTIESEILSPSRMLSLS